MKKERYLSIIGIDEVGRGPLAGPVAVGAVKLEKEWIRSKTKEGWFDGLRDSKKLSPKAREEWVVKIKQAQKEGWLDFAVAFVSSGVVDKKGLSYALRTALAHALQAVEESPRGGRWTTDEVKVLLDGGLHAPMHYKNQTTIIKGDEKEVSIALASIVAKVARDKRMVSLAKKFPQYGFEQHKGYGTRTHYDAIKKYGITLHHRKSFLKGF
ncbi:hypothetical protein AUJ77_00895 [Candidatus Nomurabacteria bacterium CG1_02_43_90]|uniref:Ribonuclease n=1 Tax=Candidatus Nomurabacteria bacterium CG1_02_43_90 TaxID=1805281 RepID=A0A1J4V4W9_9BACT|nr:MAG: hypothetical protein AUJ77_00895 [Candidatus Nomurabacteria bacterium CG1_02_43_90]